MNRQNIFTAGVFEKVRNILLKEEACANEIRDACALLRALTLDDDIRHEYGKAHEHATIIAKGSLDILTGLLHSTTLYFIFIYFSYTKLILFCDLNSRESILSK